MPKVNDKPIVIGKEQCQTGRLAHAEIGQELQRCWEYNTKHRPGAQIIAHSAPDWTWEDATYPEINPHWDCEETVGRVPKYPIISMTAPKDDSSVPYRQLGGVVIPHCVVPYFDEAYGHVTYPARITFESEIDGEGPYERTIYETGHMSPGDWFSPEALNIGGGVPSIPFSRRNMEPIELYNHVSQNLAWDGPCEFDHLYYFGVGNSAGCFAKDTTYYNRGSQSLKVEDVGTQNPYVKYPQIPGTPDGFALTEGRTYRVSARVRSDGSASAALCDSDSYDIAIGTTSTSWHTIEGTFVSTGDHIMLRAYTSITGDAVWFDDIQIREVSPFAYDPDSSGEMVVNYLRTYRMRIGAMSIWEMPDCPPTNDELVFGEKAFSPGQAIRGYTSGARPSIGDIEDRTGHGGASAMTMEDAERATRRCFFQITHPYGICTNNTSYVNLRGGAIGAGPDSQFWIKPRNLLGLSSSYEQTQRCAIVVSTLNAGVGNEWAVKFTAANSGDTVTFGSQYEQDWDFFSSTIDTRITGDYVKIEVKAPSGGYIWIHNACMFEGRWDNYTT